MTEALRTVLILAACIGSVLFLFVFFVLIFSSIVESHAYKLEDHPYFTAIKSQHDYTDEQIVDILCMCLDSVFEEATGCLDKYLSYPAEWADAVDELYMPEVEA